MNCCGPEAEFALSFKPVAASGPPREELLLASRALPGSARQVELSVPGVHCGACIANIEATLGKLDGVEHARVNLSTKRVSVRWREDAGVPAISEALARLGYESHLFEQGADDKDETLAELIRGLGIAGFAAGNIMLLSVSVWSGATDATRDLFHWISALIALPALAFSGRIFFRSAWGALRNRRTNMDVPISIGILLAFGMSLYDTANSGPHAYFDASASLLFFLLIGRTLDHVMRERARVAVKGLARLAARGATVLQAGGANAYLPVQEIEPGMRILLAAGERVPVDSKVINGRSELDCAIVSGESVPVAVESGAALRAGTLNLTGALTIEATAKARDSFLAEMARLMEAAESGRGGYRRIADRAAALYAPVLHLTAFLTFVAWMVADGNWHQAITIAIAVLIITCPCALGLAVPIVQVAAARRLFENGIMVKDGAAMERLAEIDTVVFDKTGTLTLGRPRLVNAHEISAETLTLAAAIALHSRHPISRALSETQAAMPAKDWHFDSVEEIPGFGLEARLGADTYRLGRSAWALDDAASAVGTVLSKNGADLAAFAFEDRLRTGAVTAVADLRAKGLSVEILSGDRSEAVTAVAKALGVETFSAGVLPNGKVERLEALKAEGRKVLMVGDGLNDAPALAAAHVSIAPAGAADIGRSAADFVFLREGLSAIPLALAASCEANKLIRQNLVLAVIYNAVAVPIALLGYVTPLVAALAMSGSSVIVIANGLRLSAGKHSAAEAAIRPARPFPAKEVMAS
ncbi:cadmium-translocating P-type ATPase [Aminobacter sp. SR38]|jgi:Cu2+-exporting ATPase|uniref:cation-translocating P-type ATPase n=1 Tax=Aminobacter sp. SR38 TaxID=2774562 RepID=UPI00177B7002|nr:cation-translocating P-type ATPase [Aminobacter sp. SR38]QOF69163.1 cadmium-translocating P-type ATPase [Aminobacter sp. SR38]